jgi:IS66 C-terminal element
MAKAPINIEDLDIEHLGDQELHAAMSRIKDALNDRFTTRTQEFRDLAREMGFAVTLQAQNERLRQAYFTELLTRLINGWPQARIDELMPWNYHGQTTH